MRTATLILCLGLTACTQFPELDGTVAPDLAGAAYPELLPLETLLVASAPVVSDPVETTETLSARAAALRARGSSLENSTIIDTETQSRLRDNLD